MKNSKLLLQTTLLFSLLSLSLSSPSVDDFNQIVDRVSNIEINGACYGPITLLDPQNSFSIIKRDGETYASGAFVGKGRVFTVGHSDYALTQALRSKENNQFMANVFKWLGKGKAGIRVLLYDNTFSSELGAQLSPYGVQLTTKSQNSFSNLNGFDVVVIPYYSNYPSAVTDSDILALQNFVRNGGGLLHPSFLWVWESYGDGTNPKKSLYKDFFTNKLLQDLGFLYNKNTCSTLDEVSLSPLSINSDSLSLQLFWQKLARVIAENGSMSQTEIDEGDKTISILENDWIKFDRYQFSALLQIYKDSKYFPNPNSQINTEDATGNMIYRFIAACSDKLQSSEMLAFPDAALWPGVAEVPERIREIIKLPHSRTNFIITGLFANAGEKITVSINDERFLTHGVHIYIGTGDDLFEKTEAKRIRFPKVNKNFDLFSKQQSFATPHGGMIYIYLDESIPETENVEITISNAVAAPYFNAEKHSNQDWVNSLRKRPAPFFNLECKAGLIFIYKVTPYIKSEFINPKGVCDWWDKVYALYPYLSHDYRNYKEVIMGDIDIGMGYMHSGMPIMTYLDVVDKTLGKNSELYKECSWGHFHEIGHNYQKSEWTFDGTGEVTNNIWSLYGGYVMCGFKPLENPWLSGQIESKMANYLAHPDFNLWKEDPGLALIMYAQIADAFGFDVFGTVFEQYTKLTDQEKPNTDDQRRDQWLVRLSRVVGRNLGPFFNKWGVPTSRNAQASIASLPKWLPSGF